MSSPSGDAPVGQAAARRGRTRRYSLIGAVVGAVLVLVCFLVAVFTGGTGWSLVVPFAVFLGAGAGAAFAPLFSLARDDGEDNAAVGGGGAVAGRADTDLEGAQARDRRPRD
jgi:hypothetical protein